MNEHELEIYSLKVELQEIHRCLALAKEYNKTLEDDTLEEILCGTR